MAAAGTRESSSRCSCRSSRLWPQAWASAPLAANGSADATSTAHRIVMVVCSCGRPGRLCAEVEGGGGAYPGSQLLPGAWKIDTTVSYCIKHDTYTRSATLL